jgi:four helix bundle protein
MQSVRTFRDLTVWRKAIELAKTTYQVTQRLPTDERFGLTVQMRRAAVSIASNIAEGNARQTRKDYIHYLTIARGSLAELETQLTIASALGLISDAARMTGGLAEVDRLLQGLIRSLSAKSRPTKSL